MPDVAVSALDARQQKLVENARRALALGNVEYVLTACAEVLQAQPGCLPARRLWRAAQLRQTKGSSGVVGRTLSGLTALPFTLGANRRDPRDNLVRADKLLAKDPNNLGALRLLAEAAVSFDWPETAVFAHEIIREQEPTNRENLLALGEAWLRAGKSAEALRVADEILRLHPVDAAAQTLMRKASIAQATRHGHWEKEGNYREKLNDESRAVALEQSSRLHNAPAAAEPSAQPGPAAVVAGAALAEMRSFVERYPGDLDGRFRLAELLLAAGEIEPAIAQYQQAQRSPKLRVRALLGLARGFRARRLLDLAIGQLTAAKAELPVMDDLKKEVVYELGDCLEQQQQAEAAIAQFKEIYTEDIGFRDVAAKINAHYDRPPGGVG
jgi:tetratricopeptide (TPR) repeat protein